MFKMGGVIASIRVSNVIKRALSMASGKYISLLSGDDYFCDNNYFSDAVNALDHDDTNASAYVSNYFKFWNDGSREDCISKRLNCKIYWACSYKHLSCFIFRKAVYDEGFFLNRFCDDTGLEYSCALYGPYIYSDKVTFGYRQRDKSITHSSDDLELSVIELLLFQDVMEKGGLRVESIARENWHIRNVFMNRERLDAKYQKYYLESSKYSHDLLNDIRNYNNLSIFCKMKISFLIMCSQCASLAFRAIRKITSD